MMSQVRRGTLACLLVAAAVFTAPIPVETLTKKLGERPSIEGVVSHLWTAGVQSPLGAHALGLFLGVTQGAEAESGSVSSPEREPASLLLLAAGLAGTAAYVRRRLRHRSTT